MEPKQEFYETITLAPDGAYSANDAVGEVQELNTSHRIPTGTIVAVRVTDPGKTKAALTLHIFNQEPSDSMPGDNDAFDLSVADAQKRVLKIPVTVADYDTYTNVAQALVKLSGYFYFTEHKKLWVQAECAETPTYSDDLEIQFGIIEII